MALPIGEHPGLLWDRRLVSIGQGVLGAIPVSAEESAEASPAPTGESGPSEAEGEFIWT
jgi:hypothetical protein